MWHILDTEREMIKQKQDLRTKSVLIGEEWMDHVIVTWNGNRKLPILIDHYSSMKKITPFATKLWYFKVMMGLGTMDCSTHGTKKWSDSTSINCRMSDWFMDLDISYALEDYWRLCLANVNAIFLLVIWSSIWVIVWCLIIIMIATTNLP